MSGVCFESVTLRRGGRTILDGFSGAIADGAFVAVVGQNGAGKTTLLRAILGAPGPAAGRIRRPAGVPGYLPQVRAGTAAARLCAADVLGSALGGGRWGRPWLGRADRAAIARALAVVDATALAGRSMGTLSGGERQRVLLAQALLGAPRLLLLDEPLAGLDPRRAHEAVGLVRQAQQALGATVLLTTHELAPLIGAIDGVLYLAGGRAVLGRVEEVVTPAVLSALYGVPIEVLRAGGRTFTAVGAV